MKKKRRAAVALRYDPDESAPRVVASGKGITAENIIAEAEKHEVPIHEDENLAETLGLLALGQEIPPELYAVVAQILLYVCDVDEKWGKRPPTGSRNKDHLPTPAATSPSSISR